jgi:hypothetical protein
MPGYYWCPKCHHAYSEQKWAKNYSNCPTKGCKGNFNDAKDFLWGYVQEMRLRAGLHRYPDIPQEGKEYRI